jgi:hypothetical protein
MIVAGILALVAHFGGAVLSADTLTVSGLWYRLTIDAQFLAVSLILFTAWALIPRIVVPRLRRPI